MSKADPDDDAIADGTTVRRRKSWTRRVLLAILVVLVAALAYGWLKREEIADRLIADQLQQLELPATYRIESIAPDRQVLRDIVVGDPAAPDLTIERVEIRVAPGFGIPSIGSVRLVKPRLFGSYRDGRLSLGALDPLVFPEDDGEPFALPDLVLALEDGRALIDSDFGPIGFKAAGEGNLLGGFSGIFAANAPQLTVDGCAVRGATLYGKLGIDAERPTFDGPLRLQSLACGDRQLAMSELALALKLQLDRTFDGGEGRFGLTSGAMSGADMRLAGVTGEGRASFRDDALTARYSLSVTDFASPQAGFARIGAEGVIRGRDRLSRLEVESSLTGSGLRLGTDMDGQLRDMARSNADSLVGPVLAQIRTALEREARGSGLEAGLTYRLDEGVSSLVVPQAALKGGSGATLLGLSRFQLGFASAQAPIFSGNIATGGRDLPRISGRMEQQGDGRLALRLTMADYRAGESRLGIPQLLVTQARDGSLRFEGSANATGAIPGGAVEALQLPIDGNYRDGQLSLWSGCTALRFNRLAYANLALDRRELRLCPARGRPILAYGAGGLRLAAGMEGLDLSGRLGDSNIAIVGGALGFAWPGALAARDLSVVLGEGEGTTRFTLPELDAQLGEQVAGTFANAEFRLGPVPLDVVEAGGGWSYADGALSLSGVAFQLEDREQVDRFRPLRARDASLVLADGRIDAAALLREPTSDREVVRTEIVHDLTSGIGHAELVVDALTFDKSLQPDMITPLTEGVVALAKGVIEGRGQIEWTPDVVTSSGAFSTEAFDFAALFGPVKRARGTINFTDLIGMVTAPDQRLDIGSINPGIEAENGVIYYALREGNVLAVERGTWPFLGGTLLLEPVEMRIGAVETRRYVLVIDGIDAARFVEQMDMANLAATGRFDGRLPLVFDEEGGWIDNGSLRSRPPGGNLSYIGELTYEDLGTMANFAFDSLRSLDYREMVVLLDGSLAGEIVTKVQFDGIRQGSGSKQNVVTKQIAKLPIQFKVNIRAPFYQLITNVRSLYDPSFVRDAREVGLIDANGRPIARSGANPAATDTAADPTVQTRESEKLP